MKYSKEVQNEEILKLKMSSINIDVLKDAFEDLAIQPQPGSMDSFHIYGAQRLLIDRIYSRIKQTEKKRITSNGPEETTRIKVDL